MSALRVGSSRTRSQQLFAKRLEYRRGGVLVLRSNTIVQIPVASISELAHATPAQLKGLKLSPTGGAVALRELDVDNSIPGLLRDLLGFRTTIVRRYDDRDCRLAADAVSIQPALPGD